ncbi:MAG TPA: tryptophan synthase subunit alpha [Nitrososphaeraceae archaeon]|nr:tryptophan synthase subunit alpha [Nitrososphaeraceae archaeon]
MYYLQNNRIEKKFNQLKSKKQKGLICYIMGGYPNPAACEKIIYSIVEGGADIIEIGIPFSDPIADGPVIQEASFRALQKGVTPQICLNLIRETRKRYPDLPIVIMTYSNILQKNGFRKFMEMAKEAGSDGFILPDMTIDESKKYLEYSKNLELASIFLVAPNTSNLRIKKTLAVSTGFVYVVSVYGTTGTRNSFDKYTLTAIKNIRKLSSNKKNISVGFGISTPQHVKLISDYGSDAVIVGSAIIKMIDANKDDSIIQLQSKLRKYVKSLKAACTN